MTFIYAIYRVVVVVPMKHNKGLHFYESENTKSVSDRLDMATLTFLNELKGVKLLIISVPGTKGTFYSLNVTL